MIRRLFDIIVVLPQGLLNKGLFHRLDRIGQSLWPRGRAARDPSDDMRGKMCFLDNTAVRHCIGSLNGIFQFSHIPGPRIVFQCPDGLFGKVRRCLILLVDLPEKMVDKDLNV